MKFAVIGSGGREHAIVKALKSSRNVDTIYALPGNAGMQEDAICFLDLGLEKKNLLKKISELQCDCVIVGPEGPLADGIADDLREMGLLVFGPAAQPAQLEASKIFAKEFMVQAGVPTARFQIVNNVEQVKACVHEFSSPYVLKADGLAAGKGVFICDTREELYAAAKKIFEEKILGAAGSTALLEQFQPGYELSYLILTDGKSYQSLPLAQDHKRLGDGDRGPNTGGMGVVAPLQIAAQLHEQIHESILKPTVAHLQKRGFLFRGVLFLGLMMTEDGPTVLEYNVRFGDPETQALLPLLDGDWAEVFLAVAKGEVPTLKWSKQASACVVLAAEGYPDAPKKNVRIEGEWQKHSAHSYFLHAGTALKDGALVVNGGRVLNAIGLGSTVREAIERAYAQARGATWPHRQMRQDIGAKVLLGLSQPQK